jgi:thioredoxin 1
MSTGPELENPMAVVELTKENFEQVITSNPMVIVDYWAPWCGPCRGFAPVFEGVAEENPDVVFAKVNTDEEQEIAQHFQIRSIPTLMVFKEQVVVFSQAGALPPRPFVPPGARLVPDRLSFAAAPLKLRGFPVCRRGVPHVLLALPFRTRGRGPPPGRRHAFLFAGAGEGRRAGRPAERRGHLEVAGTFQHHAFP